MEDLSFSVDSLLKDVSYDNEADSWSFIFVNQIAITTVGFWRLFEDNKIVLVSSDHGHLFGLDKPIDLTQLIKSYLLNKHLVSIIINKDTGDLELIFDDQHRLNIYISSTGYETYNLSINSKNYIGLGSGEIAIW